MIYRGSRYRISGSTVMSCSTPPLPALQRALRHSSAALATRGPRHCAPGPRHGSGKEERRREAELLEEKRRERERERQRLEAQERERQEQERLRELTRRRLRKLNDFRAELAAIIKADPGLRDNPLFKE
jgi:hypothetical protein